MTCNHTEHALRATGYVWGRYFKEDTQRGVWELCVEETQAWLQQNGVESSHWEVTLPEREDLKNVSY